MAKKQSSQSLLRSKVKAIIDKDMTSFAKVVYSQVIKNFNMQVYYDENGKLKKWLPLEFSTQQDRRYRGYHPTRPILQRTTSLKNSIKVFYDGSTIRIQSNSPYAETHQFGARNPKSSEARNIPARPFLDYPASCGLNSKLMAQYFFRPAGIELSKIIN